MRTQLQLQGIVFILFGMLLALISVACQGFGSIWMENFGFILLFVALIMGIMGVALSLSKDRSN